MQEDMKNSRISIKDGPNLVSRFEVIGSHNTRQAVPELGNPHC